MTSPHVALLLILVGLFVSDDALADVILQTYGPCEGKGRGDACTTEGHNSGRCRDLYWSDAGPYGKPDERYPKPGTVLVCEATPPLFGELPVDPLLIGLGVSFVMVGSGVFLVLRRRKRFT